MVRLMLGVLVLLLSCSMPDEVGLNYGHQFNQDGGLQYRDNAESRWDQDGRDSDFVGVFVSWRLKPLLVRSVPTPVEWEPLLPPDPEPAKELPDDQEPPDESVQETAEWFDSLDWLTRLGFLAAVCWLGWVYRERLGRLIPGGRNGTPKK